MNNKRRHGFSLVELVIVIVILGIIAAIAIPRISSGSRGAGESALRANLATLRNAIDWYYSEHHNVYPGQKGDGTNDADSEEAVISQLTMYSNAAGEVSEDKDPDYPYGPYLRSGIPELTAGLNAGSNTITVVNQVEPLTADPTDGNGWMYNTKTGQIIPNSNDTDSEGEDLASY